MSGAINWDNLSSLPVAAVAMAVGVTLAVWAYRPQVRLMGPVARWVLPGLRVVAIVALALSVLKPLLASATTEARRGAVVLVIDASQSMGVTDVRSAADKVALARALGDVPVAGPTSQVLTDANAGATELLAALDALQTAEDETRFATAAGNAPADVKGRVDDARGAVEAARGRLRDLATGATPADMAGALREAGEGSTGGRETRDRARRVLAEVARAGAQSDEERYRTDPATKAAADATATVPRAALAARAAARVLASLPAEVPVYIYAAGDEVTPVKVDSGKAVNAVDATASHTDGRGAVAGALARLGGVAVRGVVLWTDGRQVLPSREPPPATGVPVFAVNVAPPSAPHDVSVAITAAPSRVFLGESAVVRVAVRQTGAPPAPVDVHLVAGAETQTKRAAPDPAGNVSVEFTVKPAAAGVLDLLARVDPRADEATPTNNARVSRMRVLSEKLKVAAYAGSPAWDFQYLRNALQRCAWAEVRDAVVTAKGVKLPLTPEQILQQDVVILCDVDVASLDGPQWDALSQLVTLRGGSVILLANDEAVLAGYAQQPQAANLLPFRAGARPAWRVWSGERPTLRVAPAPGAADVAALRLVDDPARAQQRWREMPALFRVLPLAGLKPNVRALLVETESQSPVMTEARLGAGRSFVVGLNETWRWRLKVGERDQDRFLLQLTRYAAGEPYASRVGNASLDVDATVARPRQPVRLRARLFDDAGRPSAAPAVTVAVTRDGKPVDDVALAPAGAAPTAGRFEAQLADLPAGRYAFALKTPAGGAASPTVTLDVRADEEAELADISPDVEFMRRMADSTGGAYSTVDETAALVPKLVAARAERSQYASKTLWDSPQLFALVLACLGTEWALRKRFGLA